MVPWFTGTFTAGTERAGALHGCREPELHEHDILGQAVPPPERQPEPQPHRGHAQCQHQRLARVSRRTNPSACAHAPSLHEVSAQAPTSIKPDLLERK